MKSLSALTVLTSIAGSTFAAMPAHLTIDQSRSTVTVRLTILTSSATDSSPVTGFYDLQLNSRTAPTQLGLTDFRAALTENLILNVNLGLLGRFNSNANNLVLFYANPPTLFGPTPVTAGAFTLTDMPVLSTGTLAYNATGFVCTQMQASNLLCVDNINLADQPASAQTMGASLAVVSGVATITASINSTQPLDPANPALGSINITGTLVASGPIQCPADFNADNAVDFFDYLDFVQAFATSGPGADFNSDGVVDFFDYLDFVAAFAEGC